MEIATICLSLEDKTRRYIHLMADVKSHGNYRLKIIYVGNRFYISTSILKECHINAPSSKCIMGAKDMRKAVH